jgi:hypothetical protein|tara:strand:+ start:173 stop:439 length:267 start_codon:yes stop_codon:yes gene_type:complete
MPTNPQPPYPEYTPIVTQGMYRFVYVTDKPLPNGSPDFRIQKWYDYPKQGYKDIYNLDNQQQLYTCIEDAEYTKWLDPDGVPCYIKDN